MSDLVFPADLVKAWRSEALESRELANKRLHESRPDLWRDRITFADALGECADELEAAIEAQRRWNAAPTNSGKDGTHD
jgi:hypothetical protein